MAEGKLQPADFEDGALPEPEAPDFDLSDETVEHNSDDREDDGQAEIASSGEPEGVFALFDREFPQGVREPIAEDESTAFDAEFSENFETMFTAVEGDDSAPLFDSQTLEPLGSGEVVGSPEPDGAAMPLPIPKMDPEDLPSGQTVQPVAPAPREKPEVQRELAEPSFLSESEEEYSELPELELDDIEDLPELDGAVDLVGDKENLEEPLLLLDEPEEIDFQFADEPSGSAPDASVADDEESLDDLGSWDSEDGSLEEFSFDESDDDELYDTDLGGLPGMDSEEELEDDGGFDDFARLALGLEDDESEEEDALPEDEDFVVEDLSGAEELDPFEDIAIMSSEDVAKFESPFGDDELKFVEEETLPEDPDDPFQVEGGATEPEEDLELDPFGEEAQALAEAEKSSAEESSPADGDEEAKGEKPAKKPKGSRSKSGSPKVSFGPLVGVLSLPWRLYSSLAGFLFGVLEAIVGLLSKIPLIGIPFRILGGLLSSVPLLWKKLIVLFLLVAVVWGGGFAIGNILPKPGATIELPDSGSASFTDVELSGGRVTGEIENTGETSLQLFPSVTVSQRELLNPGTWFSPAEVGSCEGDLVEIPIDATMKVAFDCGFEGSTLSPSLKE